MKTPSPAGVDVTLDQEAGEGEWAAASAGVLHPDRECLAVRVQVLGGLPARRYRGGKHAKRHAAPGRRGEVRLARAMSGSTPQRSRRTSGFGKMIVDGMAKALIGNAGLNGLMAAILQPWHKMRRF